MTINTMKKIYIVITAWVLLISCQVNNTVTKIPEKIARDRWTVDHANEWYKQWGWLRGADFIPSTAINQLEMWQAESFDPSTIDRELGFAESIGMNSMRVYLHHAAWEVDIPALKIGLPHI